MEKRVISSSTGPGRWLGPLVFLAGCVLGGSVAGGVSGCATGHTADQAGGRLTALPAADAAALLPLPRAGTRTDADAAFIAEGRLTHFAQGQRLRAQIGLVVRRPDSFRVTVLTPQGPPALVLACDGNQLTSLDVLRSTFASAPATRSGMRELAPQLDFALPPALLVQLLSGTVVPGPDVAWSASASLLRGAWTTDDTCWQADWRRADGRLLRLLGSQQSNQGDTTSSVEVKPSAWLPQQIPGRLSVEARGPAFGGGRQTMDIVLDKATPAPAVSPQSFVVQP